ncbi:MAG: MBL fold metallo-hydrolase, partial [Gammaproteobacteria bacterium]|nr:MBL fold metallo-hydrolase [Gammaproteobacteria bacterium]
MIEKIACLLAGILFCGAVFGEDDLFSFEFEEIAPDVWAGVRQDSPRFPVMGNTMFVVGGEGVVVFDGGGAPAMAEQIIEKIRSITNKPVTHVVISHWHGDHNFGVYRFAEEFPNVQFIAHRFTAKVMESPRIAYIDGNATFVERNLAGLESVVTTGLGADGNKITEQDRQGYMRMIEDADAIDAEFKRMRVTPPNVIMGDSHTI